MQSRFDPAISQWYNATPIIGVRPSLSKYKTIISIFWLQDYSKRYVPTLHPAIIGFYYINHKVTRHFNWKMA